MEKSKEAVRQLCPCCFRSMVVKQGKVVRHGWQESGGRRQGSHGNAWHVGQCFGVGYAPYEVSCQGTLDFYARLLQVRVTLERGLARLEGRPSPLTCSYRKGWGHRAETVFFELEDDGGRLKDDEDVYYQRPEPSLGRVGTYAWHLHNQTEAVKRDLRMLQSDLDVLTKAIKNWKPVQEGAR